MFEALPGLECTERLPIPFDGFLFPHGFEIIAKKAANTVKEAAIRFVTRGRDPRIVIGVMFELLEFGKYRKYKKTFWSTLKAEELKAEIKLLSPFLCFWKAAPSTMIRKVAWVREWIAVLRKPLRDRVCDFLQGEPEKSKFVYLFALVTCRTTSRIYAHAAERKGSSL
jgi:hypothetical protein